MKAILLSAISDSSDIGDLQYIPRFKPNIFVNFINILIKANRLLGWIKSKQVVFYGK